MSSSNCCFLTCTQISLEAGQVVWYSHLLQNFPVFCDAHSQRLWHSQKAEIDAFLELSCFFHDPVDVGSLISGSSAFSKTSLNIRKFTVHILLRPGLENFEHYFTNVWDECNCVVVWAFFGIAFLWIGMKTDLFQSSGHCWVFQICWHIDTYHLIKHLLLESSVRSWTCIFICQGRPSEDKFTQNHINPAWILEPMFFLWHYFWIRACPQSVQINMAVSPSWGCSRILNVDSLDWGSDMLYMSY